MTSFLLVDDHEIVRAGIRLLIEKRIPHSTVYEAENEAAAISNLTTKKIDFLLLDLNMPKSNPMHLVDFSKSCQPEISIIILSMNEEAIYAKRYFKNGVKGYIHKASSSEQIFKAINIVMNGKLYMSDDLKNIFIESVFKEELQNPFDTLSDREFQVADLIIKGLTLTKIADTLNINVSTASTLKGKIFE